MKPTSAKLDAVEALRARVPAPLFVLKLYVLMEDPESRGVVEWGADGASLVIKDREALEETILPKYFGHGTLKSFVRQLNAHGFCKARRRSCSCNSAPIEYSHPDFVEGDPDRLCFIRRQLNRRRPSNTSSCGGSPAPSHTPLRRARASPQTPVAQLMNPAFDANIPPLRRRPSNTSSCADSPAPSHTPLRRAGASPQTPVALLDPAFDANIPPLRPRDASLPPLRPRTPVSDLLQLDLDLNTPPPPPPLEDLPDVPAMNLGLPQMPVVGGQSGASDVQASPDVPFTGLAVSEPVQQMHASIPSAHANVQPANLQPANLQPAYANVYEAQEPCTGAATGDEAPIMSFPQLYPPPPPLPPTEVGASKDVAWPHWDMSEALPPDLPEAVQLASEMPPPQLTSLSMQAMPQQPWSSHHLPANIHLM